jgi:tetratricopeptide (TPR) repeat protein
MLKKYGIFLLFFSFSILFAIPLAQLQIPFFTIKETQSYDYFIQGVNLFHQYSYKTAQQFFLKSLNVKPDFYFARRFLAESYLLDGDLESSLEEYEILRNQFPNDEFIQYKLKQIENLFFMNRNNQPLYDNRYVLWK